MDVRSSSNPRLENILLTPIDPILENYERRFTGELRKMYELSVDVTYEMMTSLVDIDREYAADARLPESERAGLPPREQRVNELFRFSMSDVLKRAAGLPVLNRQTVGQIVEALPSASGRRFRTQYLLASYPSVGDKILNTHRWENELETLNVANSETIKIVHEIARWQRGDPLGRGGGGPRSAVPVGTRTRQRRFRQ